MLLGLIALTLGGVALHQWSSKPVYVPTVIPRLTQTASEIFPEPIPPAFLEPKPITLLFVGDIMLDRQVAERSKKAKDLAYPFQKLPIGWFGQVDYAIANLEGPVTDKRRPPEKTIDFQFHPDVISILKEQGIDAVSHANNHTLDQGREGAEDSRARLQAAGLLVFGDQVRDDEIALATKRVKDERIVFVGFNTTDNPLDIQAASTTLMRAGIQTDDVIVFMHWGEEYKDRPSQSVIDQAHWLIDHGADIVIGGHPHWVQGIEIYKNKPIVYSLGNFIFDQDFSRETKEGLAMKITIGQNELALEPIPLQIDLSQPTVVEGEDREKRLKELARISDPLLKEQILGGKIVIAK
jgi:poly-gamma-glutamate synthesis protein (capsule biosynthesis protein)